MEGYLPIIELLLCALITGFFFALEPALNSINRFAVELKKKQGKSGGRILSQLLEHPSEFIGSSLVASTIALSATVLLSSVLSNVLWQWFPPEWKDAPLRMIPEWLAALIVLFFSTHLIIALIKIKSNLVLSLFARPIYMVYVLLSPIGRLFSGMSAWVLEYLFDLKMNNRKPLFGKADPEHFIQQTRETGDGRNAFNADLFEHALSLPGIKIRECLIPRKEIIGIEASSSLQTVRQKFIDTQLSRIVVYENNIDHILGYVHQQDLFQYPSDIRSILHSIPAVTESMGVTDLITLFSKERKSIAWVVDEFGGTSGIVTMEDLLEEIFGEIKDEYDVEELPEQTIAEGEYIFTGRMELDYLREKYNLEFDASSESETLSGYIVEFHETIPKIKEKIIIQQLEFEILTVSDTRIETVKVKVL